MSEVDPKILEMAGKLGKRPRLVVEHIIKHGEVSTTEINELYGYGHPPRAARDVREVGIPLKTTIVKNPKTGKRNAVYTFDDLDKLRLDILKGRQNFPAKFRKKLYDKHDNKCAICNAAYSNRELQIDHRVHYEVAGDNFDTFALEVDLYMPLCPSDNRNKSFTCESCPNWLETRDPTTCQTCYWASPENYEHIATRKEKRAELVFRDEELDLYDIVNEDAEKVGESVGNYIINLIKKQKN